MRLWSIKGWSGLGLDPAGSNPDGDPIQFANDPDQHKLKFKVSSFKNMFILHNSSDIDLLNLWSRFSKLKLKWVFFGAQNFCQNWYCQVSINRTMNQETKSIKPKIVVLLSVHVCFSSYIVIHELSQFHPARLTWRPYPLRLWLILQTWLFELHSCLFCVKFLSCFCP